MAKFLEQEACTFDDYLLVPQYTDIASRLDVALETRLTKNYNINIPIVAAPMDRVVGSTMMIAMHNLGGCAIMHRFASLQELKNIFLDFKDNTKDDFWKPCAASIGLNDKTDELIDLYLSVGVNILCIDLAHGDCLRAIDLIKYINKNYQLSIIAGSVCTYDGTLRLCDAGAHAIRCGVGGGSVCSTRLVAGAGYPQLDAVRECVRAASKYCVPVISDGGITKSADIIKALAAGAESVMCGNLLSAHEECPGDIIIDRNGNKFKQYRGMASQSFMENWKGSYHAAPEGVDIKIAYKGNVSNTVNNLCAGIRSGMTYCNARTIRELQDKAIFVKVSSNTLIENKPHGKNV